MKEDAVEYHETVEGDPQTVVEMDHKSQQSIDSIENVTAAHDEALEQGEIPLMKMDSVVDFDIKDSGQEIDEIQNPDLRETDFKVKKKSSHSEAYSSDVSFESEDDIFL